MRFGMKNLAKLILLIMLFNVVFPALHAAAYPSINISSPANNGVVTTDYVDVTGYVNDTAVLTVNGAIVYPGANGFFSYRVSNLVPGNNSIRVVAANSSGSQVTTVINVFYDSSAVVPNIVLTNPSSQTSEVASDTVTVTGSVYNFNPGSDTLEAVVNGSTKVTATVASGGAFSCPVNLDPGENVIVLTAKKAGGIQAQKVIFVRYNDQGPGMPNIYNLLPLNGTVTGKSVTVSGTVVNTPYNGLTVNGSAVSFDRNTGYFSKSLTLNPGPNTITVRATNGTHTVIRTITVYYETSPVIVVTSPLDSQTVNHSSVTITGRVFNTDSGGLYINGERVGFNSSDGSFTKTFTLQSLANTFEIRAVNGSLITTKNLTVYYNARPSLKVTSHTDGQTVDTATVVLKGTTFPYNHGEIQSMTVTHNGVSNPVTVANGTFTTPPLALEPGDNVFTFTINTKAVGSVITPQTETKTFKLVCKGLAEIDVDYPLDGSTVYSNVVTVRGYLRNADFTSLKIDGKETEIGSGGSFRQTITLDGEEKEIKIEAVYGSSSITETIKIYYNKVLRVGSRVQADVKDGGEVKAFNDSVKIKLVKGSLGLATSVDLSIADPDDLDDPPVQSAFLGPIVDIDWGDYFPAKPYTITLAFDSVVRDNQTHKVTILYFDEGEDEWQVLGGKVDAKARTISIETDKTGYFAAAMYFRTFDDVNEHWAQRDIEYLIAQGAVAGSSGNRFNPDTNVTRAEFVTFLVKALGWQPYDKDRPSYSDVSRSHWGYKYIEAALRAGLVTGVSHNRFAPDRYITREEAGVLLARAGNFTALKDQELTKLFSEFADSDKISPWAKSGLASAIKAKVLKGSDNGLLMPRSYTTRAQAAAMIARLTENMSTSKKTNN